jgi:hypothetical protein
MKESPAHRTAKLIACSLFVFLFSAVTAYYRAFVSLATYDDEGTMMWTVKSFFAGHSLYNQVATIYGPVYYFYQWCAHVLTGTPLSHHSVRLVSIAFWVTAALIVFLLAYWVTGSLLLAAVTHILAFRAMGFIGEEPAHPQEAGILLLAALGLACFARSRAWQATLLGALAGLALATKINLGIFVVIAVSTGFAYALRRKWLRTAASLLASCGILVFPVLLMWGHLSEGWAMKFCALEVISIASAILIVSGAEVDVRLDWRGLLAAGAAFAGAIAAISWFALAHGSTVSAMIDWLIVKPRTTFGQGWYLPPHIRFLAPVWALAALVLAYCVRTGRVPAAFLAFARLGFAAVAVALCLTDRYEALINFGLPLLWLIAAPSGKTDSATRDASGRALLLLLAVTQVLYAYPVAGAQLPFAAVLMICVIGICLSDGLMWIRISWCRDQPFLPRLQARWVGWAACLLLGAAYLGQAWYAENTYAGFEPLGFPGTGSMRIEPDRAAALHALVARVNAGPCRTLVTEPGLFSLNFFTGKPAPTGLNNGGWMVTLGAAAQESIVREVAQDPQACVVRRQDMVDQWTRHGDVSSQPLVRYIRENFRSVLEVTDYSFLVRKE